MSLMHRAGGSSVFTRWPWHFRLSKLQKQLPSFPQIKYLPGGVPLTDAESCRFHAKTWAFSVMLPSGHELPMGRKGC